MADRPVPRPFLKWAGGKAQLVDELVARLPPAFDAYHEPFVGGGALFFRLVRDGRIRYATLSDLNAELVDAFVAIRDSVDEVIDELSWYPHSREFYYELRAQDPSCLDGVVRAARMIYLNKTGYNGLYRVNRRGQFNVPFGRYKAPTYLDAANLRAVSLALQAVPIVCAPFASVLDRAQPGDLVYFDPPYVPLSSTARFTAYQAGGFSLDDQRHLRDLCRELTRRGVSVLVSNSDTPLVRDLYAGPPFAVGEVRAHRAINSAGDRRGKLTELVVTNYATSWAP
jgi:DNA adenine methylase